MPQRTLRFRIRQDGVVEETVEGLAGKGCQQLTEKLESSLGTVEQRQLTSESYKSPQEQTQSLNEGVKLF